MLILIGRGLEICAEGDWWMSFWWIFYWRSGDWLEEIINEIVGRVVVEEDGDAQHDPQPDGLEDFDECASDEVEGQEEKDEDEEGSWVGDGEAVSKAVGGEISHGWH